MIINSVLLFLLFQKEFGEVWVYQKTFFEVLGSLFADGSCGVFFP